MTNRPTILSLAAILLLSATAMAQPLDTNLLVNGDAETGDITGWIDGGMNAASTSETGTLGVPDCIDIGSFSFTGAFGPTTETLEQRVDISGRAAQIDAGELATEFSILLQSRVASGLVDRAIVDLEFLNENDEILASEQFEDAAPTGVFDWSRASDRRPPPVGTRTVVVRLVAIRSGGSSTDAYFDEATLRLADACRADLDGDGVLTIFDFLAFQNLFDTGDLEADFDGDCGLTIFDFLEFQNQFDAGCS